jgi:hypothetical protein
MVRREGKAEKTVRAADEAEPCCTVLAGESPAWVTAGGPSSRLPCVAGETSSTKRSVESLSRGGSKEAGCNKVNAEQASSYFQPKGAWEGRAGHFAAKAIDSIRIAPERVLDFPGVLAAARFERAVRNTRSPTQQPTSGEDFPYKARAESGRSWEGFRGVHSTWEGGEKPLEGRGPALVTLAKQVSARACP